MMWHFTKTSDMLGKEVIDNNPLILFCVDYVRIHILHESIIQ